MPRWPRKGQSATLCPSGNPYALAARALEFTILTAARTGEVIGATWAEINLEEGVWTIPAARMKAHRDHRVPLSAAALTLLKALPREKGNLLVFLGPRKN